MPSRLRSWLAPARPASPAVITDPAGRRALIIELVVVFTVTLGLSGVRSLLSLVDALLRSQALAEQRVAINAPHASTDVINLLTQLCSVAQLLAWGALGLLLLFRAGIRARSIGLAARPRGGDVFRGVALTALIGIPGIALYFLGWKLGFNLAVQPSTLDESWWRPLTLTASAAGNGFAEEVLVVGYLLTRLRQLGLRENTSLLLAAVLRGSYHLYQGLGGFVGNVVMGVIFGRIWQRTNRLWPLVLAHTLLDVCAFVGYSLLRVHLSWLP